MGSHSGFKKHETLRGPGGLVIRLDATEIFPDDPGNGTPALVVAPFGRGTSTFWCALDTGEMDGPNGLWNLNEAQMKWLNTCEEAVNQWVELRSAAIKRDGRDAALAVLA